jgi:hypothetical protein
MSMIKQKYRQNHRNLIAEGIEFMSISTNQSEVTTVPRGQDTLVRIKS